jgi:type II secretory pathway component PulC
MKGSRLTPEEKLLKIIEKPGDNKKHIKAFTRKQKQQVLLRRFSEIISFKWLDLDKILNLHALNVFLVGVSLLITVFLVYGFVSQKAALSNKFDRITQPLPQQECKVEEPKSGTLKPRDVVSEAGRQNIFTLKPEVKKEEAKKKLKPLTALKLVGILWSEENPQVMIEDNEDRKTYILNENDRFDRWKVKEITRNKVILVDDDGEWELK